MGCSRHLFLGNNNKLALCGLGQCVPGIIVAPAIGALLDTIDLKYHEHIFHRQLSCQVLAEQIAMPTQSQVPVSIVFWHSTWTETVLVTENPGIT
jgi:hypothetical protein